MSKKKTWLITGAGRGMGVDFAKAALVAGHAVVATGRNTNAMAKAVGQSNDLQAVKLDVTSRADAEATVRAAADRFGSIDVLVNNAASFYAGYFEELTPEQFERQLAVSLIGPMNVTRAVLPVMRKQHSGLHYFDLLVSGPRRRASSSLAPTPRRRAWRAGWSRSTPRSRHSGSLLPSSTQVLSHGTPHGAVDELRRAIHRGLRRAPSESARVLESPEWPAIR